MDDKDNKFNNEEMKVVLKDISNRVNFNLAVIYALQNYDDKTIEQLMDSEKYPSVNNEEKEKELLTKALLSFSLGDLETSFFEYFIFEYKISEDVYVNLDSEYKNKIVEDMFAKRKLNEDLNKGLDTNANPNKKLKV